jgi:hypothetical protein
LTLDNRSVNRVVVALLDGTRVKGFVYSFSAREPHFTLYPSEKRDDSYARFVEIAECKAIFFVRSHEGNREARDRSRKEEAKAEAKPEARVRGQKMRIVFRDGEELLASSEAYSPARQGFFAYPLDPKSNNQRIYVVNRNVGQVTTGSAAETPGSGPGPQDRIARSRVPSVGAPAFDASAEAATAAAAGRLDEGAFPVQLRTEAVLRLVAGESCGALAEELEVPEPVLAYWARVFVLHGKAGLTASLIKGTDSRDTLLAVLQARVLELEAENAALLRERDGGG